MSVWQKLAAYSYLETERLILRPFQYDDWKDFYTIVSNSENLSFIFPQVLTPYEAQELLVLRFMKEPLGQWAIVDKRTGHMIGAIGFEKLDDHHRQAELGYFILKDVWGQGFATEAVKNICFLAFQELGLRELSIITHLENIASQQVALKSGFKLLRQYKGSDRYTHQMREYKQYHLKK